MGFSGEIFQLSYQALLLILILSGPPILISMVLGLMVVQYLRLVMNLQLLLRTVLLLG